ncbi:MAG: hypothetical protein ACRDPG_09130 [Nocardioidaceae bacterium]
MAAFVAAGRRARWMGPIFAVLALLMVPWTVFLAVTLPNREVAAHYALAWSGFDVGLALALASTAYMAYQRSRWLVVSATVTAAFLVIDAWFDVTTSSDEQFWIAIASAVCVELPLAAVCGWLALNGERIVEGTVALQMRRRRLSSMREET